MPSSPGREAPCGRMGVSPPCSISSSPRLDHLDHLEHLEEQGSRGSPIRRTDSPSKRKGEFRRLLKHMVIKYFY